METITIRDKTFKISIPASRIQEAIRQVADNLNSDYEGKEPVFLCVLNGAFMFAGDLFKSVTLPCDISFVKVASYHGGTASTGQVDELIGLSTDLEGKSVIIVEDIVDTGNTIVKLMNIIQAKKPESIRVATLLYKPEAYRKEFPIDYVALEVPNDFLVGFGLDYDQKGRNLKDIYVLHEEA